MMTVDSASCLHIRTSETDGFLDDITAGNWRQTGKEAVWGVGSEMGLLGERLVRMVGALGGTGELGRGRASGLVGI